MKLLKCYLLIHFSLFCIVYSQTFKDDSIAVEAILDSNDSGIDIDNVIGVENGRVVILFLKSSMAVDIKVIPADIGRLTALKKFILLDFYGLEALPPEIGNLKELDSLVITGCELNEIPKEIGGCTSLKHLTVTYCPITQLPLEIWNCSSLTHIDLHLPITNLPPGIGDLSLMKVFICNGELDSLPVEIGNLSSLEILDVLGNRLTSLPIEIFSITKLKTLAVDLNYLTAFQDKICSLSSLTRLGCSYNQLTSLPDSFGNLSSLSLINLSRNKLTSFPASITKINLPQGDSGINLCFNPDLVFTPEQQIWAGAKDYAEYEDKYCDVAIEEFEEKESKSAGNIISVLPGTIIFQVGVSGQASLEIYNIQGRKLRALFDVYKNRGNYSISWEAERAGVYLIKLTSGKTTQIKKVTVTR